MYEISTEFWRSRSPATTLKSDNNAATTFIVKFVEADPEKGVTRWGGASVLASALGELGGESRYVKYVDDRIRYCGGIPMYSTTLPWVILIYTMTLVPSCQRVSMAQQEHLSTTSRYTMLFVAARS